MPLPPSDHLQHIAIEDIFEEVHEVVRQFTVLLKERHLRIDVCVSRYYTPTGFHYHLSYQQIGGDGEVRPASYGQVLNGSEDEESTIRTAISFIRDAHKLH